MRDWPYEVPAESRSTVERRRQCTAVATGVLVRLYRWARSNAAIPQRDRRPSGHEPTRSTPAVATAERLALLHRSGRFPDYEAILDNAYSTFLTRGMTVLDIGAHEGRHTVRFSELVGPGGKVIAFEPLPHLAEALRERFDSIPNVEVRERALGSTQGRAAFVFVENAPGESGLKERASNIADPKRRELEVDESTVDVECHALDSLHYVKLDIEGGEIDCLRGAVATIERCRPFISVEYGAPAYSGYGHTPGTLYEYARRSRYVISDIAGNVIESEPDWLFVCDRAAWDFFLVPSEKEALWRRLSWNSA